MLQRVDVALDKKQIGATLHREEATARHINTVTVLEMLNSRSRSSFELWKDRMNNKLDSVISAPLTCTTACPSSVVLGLTMMSSSMPPSSSKMRFNANYRVRDCMFWITMMMKTFQVDPQIVGVEDLELANCDRSLKDENVTRQQHTRFEIFNMLRRNLCYFKKSD